MSGPNGSASPASSAAPTSAPAPASSGAPPNAQSGGPASTGTSSHGASTTVGMAPAPPTGLQQSPDSPPKIQFPFKAKIGEQEHEIDLAEYRHKVRIDGQEYELGLDELAKNQERLRSSMKRYEDASRLKKEAEARAAQVQAREEQLGRALRDPAQAFALLRRTLGEDGLIQAAADLVSKRLEYERLAPEQRQIHDRYSKQEQELEQRRAELDRRQAEIDRHNKEREDRLTEEHRQRLLAQWVPALESAGLPAKINGEPNMRLVRMLAETLRVARANNVPLTFSEAIGEVKRDFEAMFGFVRQREQAEQIAALESQPGRIPPEVPSTPARAPAQRRPISAEEYARQLRKTWDKR